MFGKFRNWKEIPVLILALLASAVFYIPMEGSPFAISVALGVFYTIIVFGWSLADPESRLFSGQFDRSSWVVLAVHIGYTTVLLSLCGLIPYLRTHLPSGLVAEDSKGGSFLILILIILGVCIESFEENWLSAKNKAHSKRTKTRAR